MTRSRHILRTAAATLASAIHEVFPNSELLGGGETSTGFFYQFYCSYPLPPEARQMLEEQMRQIVRENREISEMEMVACSAREFFDKRDHVAAVGVLEELEPKELVSIVKIGKFAELMDGPFCTSVREMGAFKLVQLSSVGDSEYRIEGCAFATKDELKKFLRLLSAYETSNHLRKGLDKGYWHQEGRHIFWRQPGLFMRQQIISLLKKSFGSEEFKGASPVFLDQYGLKRARKEAPFSAWAVFEKTVDPEGDEGFFEEAAQSVACQTIYCKEDEIADQVISLLQRIGKTLIILGFDAELCLAGRRQTDKGVKWLRMILSQEKLSLPGNVPVPFEADGTTPVKASRIQWMARDGLGRKHPAIELEVEYKEDRFAILRAKVGVERILSLLLEQCSEIERIEQDTRS